MLGIVVTSYLPHYFLYHSELLSKLDDTYKPVFVTSHENHNFVKMVGGAVKPELYYLDVNPGKHDGTFHLISNVVEFLEGCDYVLHYHGDIFFRDGIDLITSTYKKVKEGNYKIAGIPRHWLFDDNMKYTNNCSLPVHFDFTMVKYDLFKSIFNIQNLNKYKELSIKNNHPACHFETNVYAAISMFDKDFDWDKDVYYTDSIKRLKDRFGNEPAYYNFYFEDSGVFHYDQVALDKGVIK
jgi:hypothetical protein|tara:strand:- start:1389 stop:2105 length:717 start_codon:yes stop_codon:yes gene_type:complete